MGQGWVHPSARWVLGVEQRGGRGLRAQAGTGLLPLARWAAVASQARPSRGGPPSGGLADSPLFPVSCWTWRHPGQRNAEAWDARHTDSLSLPPLPVGGGSVPSTLRLGSSLLPVACGGSHVAEAAVLGGPARPACRPRPVPLPLASPRKDGEVPVLSSINAPPDILRPLLVAP